MTSPQNSATRSLSTKLLWWTAAYVLLATALVFVPVMAQFRTSWLQEKLGAAHLAALAVEAAPDFMVTKDLEAKLLAQVDAHAIDLILPNNRVYMLSSTMPPRVDARIDLDDATYIDRIADALTALVQTRDRVLRVAARSPDDPRLRVDVMIDERPLIVAMRAFAGRALGLTATISLIVALLVYLSLNSAFVRPMRRLTESVVAFSRDPETARPSFDLEYRDDEIGVAQRELASMQESLRTALRQRERLAALGAAVAKINHDIRAVLSTAALLSEHLSARADPETRRLAPRLLASIDRAVELCGQTLSYTQDGVLPLERRSVDLAALVEETGDILLAGARAAAENPSQNAAENDPPAPLWENRVADGLRLDVDPVQLSRALVNLGRNALQAGATKVEIAAEIGGDRVGVVLRDDGPGLPPRALAHLFQPFAGSARAGGVGLGLAIAREIVRAHGGDLILLENSADGAAFMLELPIAQPL